MCVSEDEGKSPRNSCRVSLGSVGSKRGGWASWAGGGLDTLRESMGGSMFLYCEIHAETPVPGRRKPSRWCMGHGIKTGKLLGGRPGGHVRPTNNWRRAREKGILTAPARFEVLYRSGGATLVSY